MERNHDLCRQILLRLEARPNFGPDPDPIAIEGWTGEQVSYNVMLLHESGHLVAKDESFLSDTYEVWVPIRLTNAGHDFVENTRSDGVWVKVKEMAKQISGSVSFNILSQIAEDVIKRSLGMAA